MREIDVQTIALFAENELGKLAFSYPEDIAKSLKTAYQNERNASGKDILGVLLENEEIAKTRFIPLCQDTGMVVFFLKLGQDVHLINGDLKQALDLAVKRAYTNKYLRKSIVMDPLFERKNTLDNTPCILHVELVSGEKVELEILAKGFGSENMSTLTMLTPADGIEGVKRKVMETVRKAAPNACLPMILGIGIGGTMEVAATLAKHACLRTIGENNANPLYASLEHELLQAINHTGYGPQGLGGDTTCLNVAIETYPTHIAGLPLAINVGCHVSRHVKGVF
jgi:fumarate hydratase subunit alpha